jgi:glycosyltransferase involved in cell wall biosynthesis
MKILLVAAQKKNETFSPFVIEQEKALKQEGAEIIRYAHTAHGIGNYMKWVPKLHKAIKDINPDVIHAHFGLTGLLAGLAAIGTGVPVVVTYHGCDINDRKLRPFSRMAMWLAAWNIFVSKQQMVNACGTEKRARRIKNGSIIPCGIDTKLFDRYCVNDEWFDEKFPEGNKILFAGSFESYVKNPSLAKEAVRDLENVQLIELRGYTRSQVVTLMYRCKVLLLTSIREGSPQVIKEAMACGCPIVSVDVGDVAERIDGVEGCYVVVSREPKDIALALEKAMANDRTKGREKLLADRLDNEQVAKRIIEIYNKVL